MNTEKNLIARISVTEDSKIYDIELEDGVNLHLDLFQGELLSSFELTSSNPFEKRFYLDRSGNDKQQCKIKIEDDDECVVLKTDVESTKNKKEKDNDNNLLF
jgi:hypothetical protein